MTTEQQQPQQEQAKPDAKPEARPAPPKIGKPDLPHRVLTRTREPDGTVEKR